jgi:DNA repair exonuclease SbcCD ATPase subunit
LRKKTGDYERSEVVKNYLMGKSRDETAKAANVSGGYASNTIKESLERARATSPEDAAEELDVAELFNSLRKLGRILNEHGLNAEDVPVLVKTIEEVLHYTSLDELKEVLPILKGTDKGHLQAAVKLAEYEQKKGMGHEEILEHVTTAENRVTTAETKKKQLTEESEGLAANVEASKTEKMKAQQSLDDEKVRLEAERNRAMQTHDVTMDKIEQFSSTMRTLKDNGIDPSDVERLQNLIRLTRECGGNPKKLFELVRTRGSLRSQIRREKSRICRARKTLVKIRDRKEKLDAKIRRAQTLLEKVHVLKSMGWTDESLGKAITLTRQVGKPDEVLARLELLRPSVDVQTENEKIKRENEALRKENGKSLRKALRQFRRIEKQASALLDERVPHVLAEIERLLQSYIISLMSKYEELSKEYTILVNTCSYLQSQCAMYQKLLDDVIPFSLLIWWPGKLSNNAVDHLLFEVVYPKLIVWSKNKSWDERTELVEKVVISGLGLYSEKASSFLVSPDNATAFDALDATLCLAQVFFPLYASLKKWYNLHEYKGDTHDLWSMIYHLDKFYEEFQALSKQKKTV